MESLLNQMVDQGCGIEVGRVGVRMVELPMVMGCRFASV